MTLNRLITRCPATGEEMVVTRLECPTSGVTIEGRFSLGWIGALSPEQLDFVGMLLKHRNNLQKLADELGVAYNTARARLDAVEAALSAEPAEPSPTRAVIDRLAAGEIDIETALDQLRRG